MFFDDERRKKFIIATFTYLNPTGSNLSNTNLTITTGTWTRLTFTRNNRPILYTNYPEALMEHDDTGNPKGYALADNGYYINRQTVSAGEAQIFFSHWNKKTTAIKYRIHIRNLSSSDATVTVSNIGFCDGWDGTGAVCDFFTHSLGSIPVNANATAWMTPEYEIGVNTPFTGMLRFTTTQTIQVTFYAYTNASYVNGNEVVYPYDPVQQLYGIDYQVYSGIGTGYFLSVNHGTIDIKNAYRYRTNDKNLNNNEITPINIVGTNYIARESAVAPFNNLGNWCTQNHHTITLHNTYSTAKTVYGYVCTNEEGNAQIIVHGSNVKGVRLTKDENRTWKWCKITLAAGEKFTFDYQTIVAAHGSSITFHEWSTNNYT